MKKILIIPILVLGISVFSQKTDIWSGNYAIKSADLTPIDTFRIVKITDVDPKNVAVRYGTDVNRWKILSKSDGYMESIEARNFLYNIAEKENEYEQFGWTKLYSNGKIKCLDAGHLLLCQTAPKTKIKVNKDEEFFTESGLFGVRLHYGLIKLEKMQD